MAIAPHPAGKKHPPAGPPAGGFFTGYRLKEPGTRRTPLIPGCQKRLAEFAARRPRIVFNPFFAAAPPKGTSVGRVRREKYFARRECVFAHFCVKTHGSERNLFCQKRQRPFLTSSYYPRTQAFRALPSGSSTRRPAVTLTSGAAARISATDVSMPLLPLVQKGRMVFPVRS